MNKAKIFLDRLFTGMLVILGVIGIAIMPFLFPDIEIAGWASVGLGLVAAYCIGVATEKLLQTVEKSGGSR